MSKKTTILLAGGLLLSGVVMWIFVGTAKYGCRAAFAAATPLLAAVEDDPEVEVVLPLQLPDDPQAAKAADPTPIPTVQTMCLRRRPNFAVMEFSIILVGSTPCCKSLPISLDRL